MSSNVSVVGDIVGLQEIAHLLDVDGRTPHAWLYRGLLPIPDYDSINGLRAWRRETVVRWAAETGRLPRDLLGEVDRFGLSIPESRGGRVAAAKSRLALAGVV